MAPQLYIPIGQPKDIVYIMRPTAVSMPSFWPSQLPSSYWYVLQNVCLVTWHDGSPKDSIWKSSFWHLWLM